MSFKPIQKLALGHEEEKPSANLLILQSSKGAVRPQYLRLLRHWISANKKMQRFFNESKTNFLIHHKYIARLS
jgi:hypothetical protein